MSTVKEKMLLSKIEYLKSYMIDVGMLKGLNDPDTVRVSKKLDELINQYQYIEWESKVEI